MNKAQKVVQQSQLNDEKHTLKLLERVYDQARQDCENKIRQLSSRTDLENLQSIIYQKQYQQALIDQLEAITYDLQAEGFKTISEYLEKSYINGYTGVMYDLMISSGIPIIMPINQNQVVKAIQTDSKLSKGLYARLGEDVNYLKRSIRAELSRGIANGSTWNEIAGKIAKGMNSPFNTSINNAIRIARTEGHRVQQKATLESMIAAKEKGADILKQWDSTLDNKTRPHHRMLDGQIKEIEEDFEVDGLKAQAPGHFGKPKEDCNCRCCLLQRARWALDEDELDELKERAAYFGFDKTKDFEEFKQKYLHLPDNADTMKIPKEIADIEKVLNSHPTLKRFKEALDKLNVPYNVVLPHKQPVSEEEVIKALAGGDKTSGSCASVGLAYIGQKGGLNVLDFRGGESQNFFSTNYNLKEIADLPGITKISEKARATATAGKKLLAKVEEGKEYYFVCGRHAAIVRKHEGVLQYLELQSATHSGWTNFNGNVRHTLSYRFGATQKGWDYEAYMFDVDEAKDSEELQAILGYINTSVDSQMKGVGGSVK